MMELQNNPKQERPSERLARFVLGALLTALVCAVCWYFKEVLIYVVAAAVVALIGRPVMNLFLRVKIKGRTAPKSLLALLTEAVIFLIFSAVVTRIVPVISGIIENVSLHLNGDTLDQAVKSVSNPIQDLNNWLIATFPSLGSGFRIEKFTFDYLLKSLNVKTISSLIGSVASFLADMGIGVIAVCFISFFFIRDERLFKNIIAAMVPDSFEKKVVDAIGDIEKLLSRYFVGMLVEITAVAMMNFLGLAFVAKLGIAPALGIAFIAGLLNVIPYVGPWIGAAIGTGLGLILKFSALLSAGGGIRFLWFTLLLIAIFAITQLIDNFLLQPYIYSTSIKAKPLEIFIVLLIAGYLGGIFGMLVAIPAYTVVRVIAGRFFGHVKAIRRLMPEMEENAGPEKGTGGHAGPDTGHEESGSPEAGREEHAGPDTGREEGESPETGK